MTSDIRVKGFFKARMIEDIGASIEDRTLSVKDFFKNEAIHKHLDDFIESYLVPTEEKNIGTGAFK